MITNQTEKQLKNLGMNLYEVKIWTALLSRGVSTAGELSDIANVPRSRSYDVLESLEKKGFIVIKKGKPTKYSTVPPKVAIKNIKKNKNEETKTELEKIDYFKDTETAKQLNNLHAQGARRVGYEDLHCSLKGKYNIFNQVANMLRKAEKNVLMSATPKDLNVFARQFNHIFEKLKNKNVDIQILTQINTQTRRIVSDVEKFASVKNMENTARFCIVDGKEIVFMVTDDNMHPDFDVGIWVNSNIAKDLGNLIKNN